jgi:Kazal-type serine protease inhibitor-like protein
MLSKPFLPRSFLLPKVFTIVLALILVVLIGQTARAVGIGGTCAGRAGLGCDDGLWCDIEPGTCKRADAEGRCVHAPQACNLNYRPVCACGGRTYGNDCERQRAKVQKSHDGRCR